MKLVFYSGGHYEENEALDLELIHLTGKEFPSITYVSSGSEYDDDEFDHFADHFQKTYGLDEIQYFPVQSYFSASFAKFALRKDIVFLSGGNTYAFLKRMKETGLFHMLYKFLYRGGVLAGLSAGGIIMTPNINTAGFPEFDRDDNDVELQNFEALDLVNFEFFPHYVNNRRYRSEILDYSKFSDHQIYALKDGSGIVIDGEKTAFVGEAFAFINGSKFPI